MNRLKTIFTLDMQEIEKGIFAQQGVKQEKEYRANLDIAMLLRAHLVEDIILIKPDNREGVRSPDAIIGQRSYEFKTNQKGTKRSFDKDLRKGKKQAENVVIRVTKETDSIAEGLFRAINSNVNRRELNSITILFGRQYLRIDTQDYDKHKALESINAIFER